MALELARFGEASELFGWNGKIMTGLRGSDSLGGFSDLGIGTLVAFLVIWYAIGVFSDLRKGEAKMGRIVGVWIAIGIVFGKPTSLLPIILIVTTLGMAGKQLGNHHAASWGSRGEKATARQVGRSYFAARFRRWGHRLRKAWKRESLIGKALGKLGDKMNAYAQKKVKQNMDELHMQEHMEYAEDALIGGEKELADSMKDMEDHEQRTGKINEWVLRIIPELRKVASNLSSISELTSRVYAWGKQLALRIIKVFKQEIELDEKRLEEHEENTDKKLLKFSKSLENSLHLFLESILEYREDIKDSNEINAFFSEVREKVEEACGKDDKGKKKARLIKSWLAKVESRFTVSSKETRNAIQHANLKRRTKHLDHECSRMHDDFEKAKDSIKDVVAEMRKVAEEISHQEKLIDAEVNQGQQISHASHHSVRSLIRDYYSVQGDYYHSMNLQLIGSEDFARTADDVASFCWDITQRLIRFQKADKIMNEAFANMQAFVENLVGNARSRKEFAERMNIEKTEKKAFRQETEQLIREKWFMLPRIKKSAEALSKHLEYARALLERDREINERTENALISAFDELDKISEEVGKELEMQALEKLKASGKGAVEAAQTTSSAAKFRFAR